MSKNFKISFLKCWKWFAAKTTYLLICFPQLIGIQNFKKISFLLYKWRNENEINIRQEDVRMKVLQYAYKTYYCKLICKGNVQENKGENTKEGFEIWSCI